MNKTQCDQTKCTFLQIGMGCRNCDTCGTEPYLIDDNCDRCWNCKSDEGILRWNSDTPVEEQKDKDKKKKKLKPIEAVQ